MPKLTPSAPAENHGTIFRITPDGVLTTLVYCTPALGTNSEGGFMQGSDGYLYGTMRLGGANGSGTVFRMTLGGVPTKLANLGSGAGGAEPIGPLVGSDNGYFYGTARVGGQPYKGTVYRMAPNGAPGHGLEFYGNRGCVSWWQPGAGQRRSLLRLDPQYNFDSAYGTIFRFVPETSSTTTTVTAAEGGGRAGRRYGDLLWRPGKRQRHARRQQRYSYPR